jgi:hypothetical protein
MKSAKQITEVIIRELFAAPIGGEFVPHCEPPAKLLDKSTCVFSIKLVSGEEFKVEVKKI